MMVEIGLPKIIIIHFRSGFSQAIQRAWGSPAMETPKLAIKKHAGQSPDTKLLPHLQGSARFSDRSKLLNYESYWFILNHILNHYSSLFINIYHCLLLSITIHHYLSLSLIIYGYLWCLWYVMINPMLNQINTDHIKSGKKHIMYHDVLGGLPYLSYCSWCFSDQSVMLPSIDPGITLHPICDPSFDKPSAARTSRTSSSSSGVLQTTTAMSRPESRA